MIVAMDNVFVHGPVCATILQRRVVDPNAVVPVLTATRRDVVRHTMIATTVTNIAQIQIYAKIVQSAVAMMMVWMEIQSIGGRAVVHCRHR